MCLDCQYLTDVAHRIGDGAKCLKYEKIPKRIFSQSGDCRHYAEKEKREVYKI